VGKHPSRCSGVAGTAYRFNGSSSKVVVNDDPSLDRGASWFTATVHVKFTNIPPASIGADYDLIRKGLGGHHRRLLEGGDRTRTAPVRTPSASAR
jgi:hypothetical protein